MCYHHPKETYCSTDSVCADSDACTCDLCINDNCYNIHAMDLDYFGITTCGDLPVLCCKSDEDCDGGGPCAEGACVDSLCEYTPVPGCEE